MGEPVHTIYDYFDQPLRGIADFEGKPHHYEREFDETADDFTDVFRLTPISESIFKLAMEKWQIWSRWLVAFQAGTTTIDSHPALPAERPRYEELQRLVDEHIANARTHMIRARGRFAVSADRSDNPRNFEVEWLSLDR